jgi:circadian clock protein KaiB
MYAWQRQRQPRRETGVLALVPEIPEERRPGGKGKMRRRRATDKTVDPLVATVVMRLYISGNGPNSVRAIANLEAICQEYLKDGYKVEIVDVFEQPIRALTDGVLVTPSLAKVSPAPVANVVGNLSDRSNVLLALGIEGSVR